MLITTVVGSYPTDIDVHSEDDARKAIEIAVNDQIKAGISVISDGQVRADMVGIFAMNMRGYRHESGRYHITGRIESPDTPATVQDYLYAKKAAGGKVVVKGIVTGPT